MAAKILMPCALLAVVGCGPALLRARLSPPPSASGVVELAVPEVAAPFSLIAPSDSPLGPELRMAVRVVARNRGGSPAHFQPGALRLFVTGFGGQQVVAQPIALVEGPPDLYHARRLPELPAVRLGPGEERAVWIVFDGFGGLPAWSSAEVRLLDQAQGVELLLASPTKPAPRWDSDRRDRRLSVNIAFAGTSIGDDVGESRMENELLYAWGRFVAGGALSLSRVTDRSTLASTNHDGFGLGLRAGWIPFQFPLGVVAGASVSWLSRERQHQGEGGGVTAVPNLFVALRWNLLPRSRTGATLLPVFVDGISPVGLFTLDAGYVRWLGADPWARGNGVGIRFGMSVPN